MADSHAVEIPISEVVDPLDEVLQHTSEQTLRIGHVDESVGEVKQGLADLSDVMQAGLTEIRTAVAMAGAATEALAQGRSAAGGGAPVSDDAWRHSLSERLDELEASSKASAKTHTIVLAVGAVQLVLLLVLMLVALGVLRTPAGGQPAAPVNVMPSASAILSPTLLPAAAAPSAVAPVPAPLASGNPGKAKKRRR